MDCVRINCAHDTREVWGAMLQNLRRAEHELGRTDPVQVLMDLAGPKVRTRRSPKAEKQRHQSGDRLLLVPEHQLDEARHGEKKKKEPLSVVGCTLHEPLVGLQVGQPVYIDDGRFAARVVELRAEGAVIELLHVPSKRNRIRSDKRLNFPETDFSVSSLTDKDRLDLDFVATHADMIGYSFVQTSQDVDALVAELAAALPEGKPRPTLVLKIETQRAVQNLPALIVQAAGQMPTAVMIARGDLAIELGFQRIAEMQEEILWLCEAAHVPVIWATQVLEGLAKEGLPTRAEVTDAAMASRAECVMLNKGPHIAEAVRLLDEVLTRMEGHQHKKTPQLRALRAWSEH